MREWVGVKRGGRAAASLNPYEGRSPLSALLSPRKVHALTYNKRVLTILEPPPPTSLAFNPLKSRSAVLCIAICAASPPCSPAVLQPISIPSETLAPLALYRIATAPSPITLTTPSLVSSAEIRQLLRSLPG